jgi:hypothetical protein
MAAPDALGILSKSGVKFLKNLCVEPLWNTGQSDHLLDGVKKLFPEPFCVLIFPTSPHRDTRGSAWHAAQPNFKKSAQQWNLRN